MEKALTAALDHFCAERLAEARVAFLEILGGARESKVAWNGLGATHNKLGQLDDAVNCFRNAIAFDPVYLDAHNNLGNALAQQGKWEESLASYEQALQLAPLDAEVRWNRSLVLLICGDLQQGFSEFEWGRETGRFPQQSLSQPLWQGEDISGKTILVHAEQGLGDAIQFLRYAPLIKPLGARVVVGCHQQLVRLFSRCHNVDQVVGEGSSLPPFDTHVPFMSLPRIFQTTLATIPADIPYLTADPTLASAWQQVMDHIPGYRIGICWRGGRNIAEFSKRDIPLDCFMSLTELPNVQLIRLQKDIHAEELARFPNHSKTFSPGADFDDSRGPFMDTAAIMKNLDLVITSDTAIAHLAGALGVPVWVALPYVPDWRWLLGRSDSPWYPTMRLFRQKSPGDWAGVFAEIQTALRERLPIGSAP